MFRKWRRRRIKYIKRRKLLDFFGPFTCIYWDVIGFEDRAHLCRTSITVDKAKLRCWPNINLVSTKALRIKGIHKQIVFRLWPTIPMAIRPNGVPPGPWGWAREMGTPAPNDIIWGRTEITIETPVYKYDRKDFSGYAYKHKRIHSIPRSFDFDPPPGPRRESRLFKIIYFHVIYVWIIYFSCLSKLYGARGAVNFILIWFICLCRRARTRSPLEVGYILLKRKILKFSYNNYALRAKWFIRPFFIFRFFFVSTSIRTLYNIIFFFTYGDP